MKNIYLTICIAMLFVACESNETPRFGKASVDKVIKAMTLEEKVQLLVGTGMAGLPGDSPVIGETQSIVPGAAGTTFPIPRLGIPAMVVADGPAGLRINPKREGDAQTYYCTAFPIGTLLASTWNAELVESVGKAMGNEVLEYGADVILGPALNIHRNPLCGRNFEYYSEDPLVSGKIAAAMVRGIQSNGTGTSVKHFTANNQETNRMGNDVRISPRALREIYLKGFEIVVKEAQPWTVMSSYNAVNGTLAAENHELLTVILRDEWGFKGTVMTDWFGGKNPPAIIHAGNDLLMPGTSMQSDAIMAAINDGTLAISDVNLSVKRILNLILTSPRFKGYDFSNHPDLQAHADITRQSAAEGMILLKNEQTLPLPAQTKTVAAFGITSYDFISGGTGSGDVNKAYNVSLDEGMKNAGYDVNSELADLYAKYIENETEKNKPDPFNPAAMFMPKTRPAEMIPSPSIVKKMAEATDIALLTIGRTSGEFMDRKIADDFDLSDIEHGLIQAVCDAYHAVGKKVVVVLNIGGVIETASWKDWPDAILLAWQAGQEGGNSVTDILKGAVNPSGKLTMTFPVNYIDAASSANFPYDYQFDMRTALSGFMGQGEVKQELVRNVDFTNYEEDIYVGYRYFSTFDQPVSYPFGYGLSYTNFDYSDAKIAEQKGLFTITVNITNTGKVAGKEVAQLYVSAPANPLLPKPAKELKAFVKTRELQPGEMQTVTMVIKKEDLASYDETACAWVIDKGDYKFIVGNSSNSEKALLNVPVASQSSVKTNDVLNPKEPINVLKR